MKRLGNIFSFTFIQHVKQKGYRNGTIIIAFLCVLLPAVILPAMEYFKEDESYESRIAKVYVIEKDDRTKGRTDYEVLNTVDPNRFSDIAYELSLIHI